MSIYPYIVKESPVRLWGLSSRERLQRLLKRAGVMNITDNLEAVPAEGTVLLIRGDYLYDNRIISNLVKTNNIVLEVPSTDRRVAVAAHVPAGLALQAREVLYGVTSPDALPEIQSRTPETLCSAYQEQLRKFEPVFVLPITAENRRSLEQRLFSGAYKGVTDLITKWAWPRPAQWGTRWCVRHNIQPNQVTGLSLILVIVAGILFAYGQYGWGLLFGWIMTFLDTVDGKLARVTVTSSRFGHILDHGLDLIHPPLWYIAWGVGLSVFQPGIPWLSLDMTLWLIVIGYIAGRLVEGTFQHWLGAFGIFCWRPIDSYFRLITARRNPNLILLTGATALGRPDLGLLAVAFWTVLTSFFLLLRLLMAWYLRMTTGSLRSWFQDIEQNRETPSLAEKLFAR